MLCTEEDFNSQGSLISRQDDNMTWLYKFVKFKSLEVVLANKDKIRPLFQFPSSAKLKLEALASGLAEVSWELNIQEKKLKEFLFGI